MKRLVIVDVDTDRNPPVIIAAPRGQEANPVADMAVLCEGLVVAIHAAARAEIKNDFDSIKDCLEHIQKGFADETYQAMVFDKLNEGKVVVSIKKEEKSDG